MMGAEEIKGVIEFAAWCIAALVVLWAMLK